MWSLRALHVSLRSHARLPLHRNAYALIASAGSTAVFGLAYWILAARTYDRTVVGTQSATISAMLLLAGIAELGADTLVLRFLPAARDAGPRLLISVYCATATVAAVAAVTFVLGTSVWSPPLEFLRASGRWFAGFTIATAGACIFALQDSVLTGMRRATWVPIENSLVSLAKIVLLASLTGAVATAGIFASWNIATALGVVSVNALVFGRVFPSHKRAGAMTQSLPPRRDLVRYAFGNYVGSLFALATINLVPLLVIYRLGAAAAGAFIVPWAIFNGLQLLATSICYSLIVEVAADTATLRPYFRRALIQTFLLLVPLCAVLVVAGPTLLSLLGPHYESSAGDLFRWLALAAIPAGAIPLAITVARLRNATGLVALIQSAWSLLVLGGSYGLMGVFGLTGIGVAAFAGSVAVAIGVTLTLLRPLLTGPSAPQRGES
jgi:O-antigen/teichoic acid export membrane protein